MWSLPAPGQVFSVGVGLPFVLLCRLSRVPCPLFCLELTSLWQFPLFFLILTKIFFVLCLLDPIFVGLLKLCVGILLVSFLGYVCCLTCFPCLAFGLTLVGLCTSFASGHRCSPDFRSSVFSLSFSLGTSVFRVRSHGRSGKSSARCVSGPHWFAFVTCVNLSLVCLLVFVFGCLLRFRSGDTTPRSKSRSRSPLRCLARMFGGRGLSPCCFF